MNNGGFFQVRLGRMHALAEGGRFRTDASRTELQD